MRFKSLIIFAALASLLVWAPPAAEADPKRPNYNKADIRRAIPNRVSPFPRSRMSPSRFRRSRMGPSSLRRSALSKKKRRKRGARRCRFPEGKKKCFYDPHFHRRPVSKKAYRKTPLPEATGFLKVHVVSFDESLAVNIFQGDGSFNEESLAALDHAFRCRRTNEERAVNPHLYELLSLVYEHFGQKPIEIISGFRLQDNQSSRHFHASAVDFRIRGVSARRVYRYIATLDTGKMGLGIYPHQKFVHLDLRAPGVASFRWLDTSPSWRMKKRAQQRRQRRRANSRRFPRRRALARAANTRK